MDYGLQRRADTLFSVIKIGGQFTYWQAYGYRDETYLHLKIYDLPNLSTGKDL